MLPADPKWGQGGGVHVRVTVEWRGHPCPWAEGGQGRPAEPQAGGDGADLAEPPKQ